MMKPTFSILIFLFLISLSSANAYTCANDFGTKFIGDLGGPIGIAIFLTVLLIVISFMVASITNNPNFTIFYKDELFHFGVSALMLVSIASVFYFSCTVTTTFMDAALTNLGSGGTLGCYGGTESPQIVAKCYTTKMEGIAKSALRGAVRDNLRQEMDSSYTFGLFNPITGGIITPIGAYKRTYAAQLDMVANTFIMPALISISTQKLIIEFSQDIVLFIIPVGIFLRFLPPTRQLGNIFLAIALGIYVILPVIYSINGIMDDTVFAGCAGVADITGDVVMGGCNSQYGFWNVARIIPYAYFLPNMSLAIFITFLSAINKALRVIT